MIRITEFRQSLEKSAASPASRIGGAIGDAAWKIIRKHPVGTAALATIGTGAIALKLSDKIHSLYDILWKERKGERDRDQLEVLRRIAANTPGVVPPQVNSFMKLKTEPLA